MVARVRRVQCAFADVHIASSGLSDDRFAAVTGKADTEPLFPDNPYVAANRRITILMLKEAPPLPAKAKP